MCRRENDKMYTHRFQLLMDVLVGGEHGEELSCHLLYKPPLLPLPPLVPAREPRCEPFILLLHRPLLHGEIEATESGWLSRVDGQTKWAVKQGGQSNRGGQVEEAVE